MQDKHVHLKQVRAQYNQQNQLLETTSKKVKLLKKEVEELEKAIEAAQSQKQGTESAAQALQAECDDLMKQLQA